MPQPRTPLNAIKAIFAFTVDIMSEARVGWERHVSARTERNRGWRWCNGNAD
jgi:hypothetical protein